MNPNTCNCDDCINSWYATAGRVLLGLIFIIVGFSKITGFAGTVGYVASAGFPMPEVFTVLAIIFEFGGAAMLILGFQARIAAWMLIVFSLVASAAYHMNIADQMQQLMLLKNLAIVGGLLFVAGYGPGKWALSQWDIWPARVSAN